MCNYCDIDADLEFIIDETIDCGALGKLFFGVSIQGYDDLCLDCNKLIGKGKINYCPMCGEKLKKEKK